MFRYPNAASYLTPLDFFIITDCTGSDPSKYYVKGFVTGEKFYSSAAALRKAFEAGELKQQFTQDRNPTWGLVDYKPELGTRPLEERFAPQSLEIGGKRYKVDAKEQVRQLRQRLLKMTTANMVPTVCRVYGLVLLHCLHSYPWFNVLRHQVQG